MVLAYHLRTYKSTSTAGPEARLAKPYFGAARVVGQQISNFKRSLCDRK